MIKLIVNYCVMTREEAILQVNVILQIVNQRMYPVGWRIGQALFNMCYVNFPEQVDTLRGTDKDCFYKNDKKELFINALLEQFESKPTEDLQKEAFEAGRKDKLCIHLDDEWDNQFLYKAFEDYLKDIK